MKTMTLSYGLRLGLFIVLIMTAGCAAEQASVQYQPKAGQPGKDIIWLPTAQVLTERMLDAAKVTPKDYVIDLGSGDGRIVIAAAKRGARALGVEYNRDLVELSKRASITEGVSDKTDFVTADIFQTDFSQATVITMFLNSDINLKLRPKLFALKPGTRIVSNTFTLGEWQPDEELSLKRGCVSFCTAYLWIVPTKVAGTWQFSDGQLTLAQSYQMVSGRLRVGDKVMSITNGMLD